ncbi:MAG: efflux RND transporter periplasmic adaptor subunit [Pseudomonadota bacterium]
MEPGESMSSERAMLITVTEPTVRDVNVIERTMGRLRARTAPTLRAEVSSPVQEVHVEVGEMVEAGELLATLDPEPHTLSLNAARGEHDRLAAMVRNQRRQVDRLRSQAEEDYVSTSEMDAAETQLDELEAQLASARANVGVAERRLRLSRVKAPVSGQITERMISEGDLPNIGEPLFALVSTRGMSAELPFPETATGRIESGMTVRLALPAHPDDVHEAPITAVSRVVGDASRAFEAVVLFDNPKKAWQHGAGIIADVVRETRQDAVTVPEISLIRRPDGPVVYTIRDGKAVENAVEPGYRDDGWVEIRSGIEAGDRIAADGAYFLSDGADIRTRDDGDGDGDGDGGNGDDGGERNQ